MNTEMYYELRHKRIEQKWKKLKSKCKPCPNCGSTNIELADAFLNKFYTFHVECENCYWCGYSRPVIRWAIWRWNLMSLLKEKE